MISILLQSLENHRIYSNLIEIMRSHVLVKT
jgi:hypothetical protein